MSSQEAQGRYVWLLNRLRCMTPAEVAHRALHALSTRIAKPLQPQVADRPPCSFERALPDGVDAAEYARHADAIVGGRVPLFSQSTFDVGSSPAWNRCPLTGVVGPAVPASTISITDRSVVGDIKHVWELNRHLQWVTLAQAARLTGGHRYLDTLTQQIKGWLAQCPPGIGPNWTSSLELAIRLINWATVWQLCGDESLLFAGEDGRALRGAWLSSIEMHVRHIARNYSRHSSANNHLIGELAGVFVASRQWPCWPAVRQVGDVALVELEREAALQISDDGVGLEQAFAYQVFVAEFLIVTAITALRSGDPIGQKLQDRLAGLMCFVRAVRTRNGTVPNVGDADDAEVLRTDPRPGKMRYDMMLQLGAWLYGRPDWLADGMQNRDEALWMIPERFRGALFSERQPGLDYKVGGYLLFESHAGLPREIKGLFDVGPLGYLGIAAHGHADALQVCLSVGGLDVLVDPGTYAYWCPKEWRDYFRGTAAHNTVRVGGVDQSQSGGRFMWVQKANATLHSMCRSPSGKLSAVASHDGYRRLGGRHVHQRRVEFDPDIPRLTVIDEVSGDVPADLELHWHLSADCDACLVDQVLTIELPIATLTVAIAANAIGQLSLLHGQVDPALGWESKAYEEKRPAPVLRWRGKAKDVKLSTLVGVRWKESRPDMA